MIAVFLRDLVGPRRLVTGALVVGVAIAVAGAVPLRVSAQVYLFAVVLTAAVTTALVLASYYRPEQLREYVQLPVSSVAFRFELALAAWLIVLIENVAAAVAFGLVRGELDAARAGLMVVYALAASSAVLLTISGRRTWAGPVAVLVTVATGAAAVTLTESRQLALAVLVALVVLTVSLAATSGFGLLSDRATQKTHGASANYVLTVVARERVILINGLGIAGFALLFTFATWEQGLTIPAAFALVSVNSPLGTVLSADPDLRTQFAMLGRPRRLLTQYAAAVGAWFAVVNAALVAFYLWLGSTALPVLVGLAVVCTVAEMAAFPFLEARFPLTRGRTPRDAWRHPRKYILPAILLGLTALVAL